jgi:parallel beta-helix repeat protein
MSYLLFWLLSNRPVIVARDGSGDYESLSEALAQVKPGGRIEVRKGHYTEDILDVDKPVTIVGSNQKDVTINVKQGVRISHSGVTLRELTIRGLRATPVPAPAKKKTAQHRRSVPVLPAAILFQAGAKNGGDAEGGSSILSSVDTKQKATRSAIRVTDGKPSILNCAVTSEDGVGIIVEGQGTRPTIRDCRIHDCRRAGLYCKNGAAVVVEDCQFEANGGAGVVLQGGDCEFRKCRIQDTKPIVRNTTYGLLVLTGTQTIEECEITGARSGIFVDAKADASILHCKVTGSSLVGLQLLGNARVTDRCEVTGSNIGIYVGPKGKVRFDNCLVSKNTQRGFLIDGEATIENCTVTNQKERGIQVSSKTGNATISNTRVFENGKHGIAVWGKARIDGNCDVYKNGDDGLYVHEGATATVSHGKFRDGSDVGVVCFGTLEMSQCEVSRNRKGGVSIQEQGRGTLRNVTVDANKGTGVAVNGTATLENCTITGNDYSGVYVGAGNAEVTSCRINSNKLYGVYVGSQTLKNLTKYGAATISGGDLTKNLRGSTARSNTRASLTLQGSVKTDSVGNK